MLGRLLVNFDLDVLDCFVRVGFPADIFHAAQALERLGDAARGNFAPVIHPLPHLIGYDHHERQ